MRLGHFDLNLLLALEALLDTRSVTQASRRLNRGQSAVSSALGRLRDHFGDPLLVPVGRSMVLTPLAGSLIRPLHETLVNVRHLVQPPPEFDPTSSDRRYVICVADYLALTLFTGLARRLEIEAPGVSLRLLHNEPRIEERLDRHEIDFAIWPDSLASSRHPHSVLLAEESVCVVWDKSALAKEDLTEEKFLSMGHAVVKMTDDSESHFEKWLLDNIGTRRRVEVTTSSFNLLPHFIIGTDRIGLMHRKHAEHLSKLLPLHIFECPLNLPPVTIVLQWHFSRQYDPGHDWIRGLICDEAEHVYGQNN